MSPFWRWMLGIHIRGWLSIVIGLILIPTGLWFLLVLYPSAPQTPLYFRVPFYLIVGGFFRLVVGVATLEPRQRVTSYARPARSAMTTYVAPPTEMPPGYCWQCGRKVKPKHSICFGCGATQVRGVTAPYQPDNAASQSWWEISSAMPASGSPWNSGSPPPHPSSPPRDPSIHPPGVASQSWSAPPRSPGGSFRQQSTPQYQPGALPPWLPPSSPPAPQRGGGKRRRARFP